MRVSVLRSPGTGGNSSGHVSSLPRHSKLLPQHRRRSLLLLTYRIQAGAGIGRRIGRRLPLCCQLQTEDRD